MAAPATVYSIGPPKHPSVQSPYADAAGEPYLDMRDGCSGN